MSTNIYSFSGIYGYADKKVIHGYTATQIYRYTRIHGYMVTQIYGFPDILATQINIYTWI